MGQTRPVTVLRLFVKDSVEERINTLNAQRLAGGAKAGSAAMDDLLAAKGKGGKNKLLVGEIAGAIREDKQVLRLAELEVLFS